MIIDTLDNLGKYVALHPRFANVAEFLKEHDLNTMEVGNYPIKDKDVVMKLSLTKQRTKETAFLETHIEMIDIQVPVTCAETFGYSPLCDLPAYEYDVENDITKYGSKKPQTYVTVNPGQFVIFFPQDGHAPCIIDQEDIKKAIFKIKVIK
jgi:YhcH/YjgK/YiaL family protein